MKYYVQVNRRWLVSVDAPTALCAERTFLDLDGVQYSNAFSNDERRTDAFRGALLDCETISRAELEIMSAAYASAWNDAGVAWDKVAAVTGEIERLQALLNEAKIAKRDADLEYQDALTAARKTQETLGLAYE